MYKQGYKTTLWVVDTSIALIQILSSVFVLVQLEKVIGKLKTEKYGNKILEQIVKYSDFEPTDEQLNDGRAAKRSKTKKNLVLIESSEDEAWQLITLVYVIPGKRVLL